MRILDLFCGAGGAAMGLHQAWPEAEIIGVDMKQQPRYPFTFLQGDALTICLEGFDFIWASPPCQAHTALKTAWNAKPHPNLVAPIRERLITTSIPYCIENVPGAPLIKSTILCGSMFDLQTKDGRGYLRRHRLFETSFPLAPPRPCNHSSVVIGVYGGHARDRRRAVTVVSKGGGYNRNAGRPSFDLAAAKEAMGIDWMDSYTLSQAIPPAYSKYIMEQFMVTCGVQR